jgi:hypothetical protein
VIAHAGVDEDRVVARSNDVALHAEDDPAGGIDGVRLQPRAVLRQHFSGQVREELQGIEEGPLLLDNPADRDPVEAMGEGHR